MPADQPAQSADHGDEHDVGREYAVAHPRPLCAGRDPRSHDHRDHRPESEHHQRIADHPVGHPAAPFATAVFRDRQRDHVSHAAALEVARRSVVDRVIVAPPQERREHEQAHDSPHVAIRALGVQKRSVRAVVKDDKRAHQKACGQDHQPERERPRDAERQVDQRRAHQVRHDGGGQFQQAARQTGLGVARKRFGAGAAACFTRHGLLQCKGRRCRAQHPRRPSADRHERELLMSQTNLAVPGWSRQLA